jgi:hypothetical protein
MHGMASFAAVARESQTRALSLLYDDARRNHTMRNGKSLKIRKRQLLWLPMLSPLGIGNFLTE